MKQLLNAVLGVFMSLLFIQPFMNVQASQTRVFDQANLLKGEEIAVIEQEIKNLQNLLNADVAIVTTNDTLGMNTLDFSDVFYYEQGLGFGELLDGVLFTIDMANREIDILTEGKMIDLLTDERVEAILDDAFYAISNGDYYETVNAFLIGVTHYAQLGFETDQYRLTDQRLFDEAFVFNEIEKNELSHSIQTLENRIGVDVLVITMPKRVDQTSDDFIKNLLQEHGFDRRMNPNGIILLMDTVNQEVYLYPEGDVQAYLTPSRIQRFKGDITDALIADEHLTATQLFLENVEKNFERGIPLSTSELVIMLGISVTVGAMFYGITTKSYRSSTSMPKFNFRKKTQLQLRTREDQFLTQNISKVRLPKNPPPSSGTGGSSGGSSRSTVRTTSSGRSRGGGGRSF